MKPSLFYIHTCPFHFKIFVIPPHIRWIWFKIAISIINCSPPPVIIVAYMHIYATNVKNGSFRNSFKLNFNPTAKRATYFFKTKFFLTYQSNQIQSSLYKVQHYPKRCQLPSANLEMEIKCLLVNSLKILQFRITLT